MERKDTMSDTETTFECRMCGDDTEEARDGCCESCVDEYTCANCGDFCPDDSFDRDGYCENCADEYKCHRCRDDVDESNGSQLCAECYHEDRHDDYDTVIEGLDEAFDTLREKYGFVRVTDSCCGSCSASEANHLAEAQVQNGKPCHGAIWYSVQDLESLHEGGAMYIGFGAHPSPEKWPSEADELAGHRVVAAIRETGLVVEWDGSVLTRIRVKGEA